MSIIPYMKLGMLTSYPQHRLLRLVKNSAPPQWVSAVILGSLRRSSLLRVELICQSNSSTLSVTGFHSITSGRISVSGLCVVWYCVVCCVVLCCVLCGVVCCVCVCYVLCVCVYCVYGVCVCVCVCVCVFVLTICTSTR